MAWLDDTDLRALRDLATAFDVTASAGVLRGSVLDRLASLLAVDSAGWRTLELSGRHSGELAPGETGEATEADEPTPRTGSVRLYPYAVRPRHAARLLDPAQPVQQPLVEHNAGGYRVAATAWVSGREAVAFTWGRDERPFSLRDRDLLALARPVLEQTLRAADVLERSQQPSAVGSSVAAVTVALDDYGEVADPSPVGQRWLTEHFGAAEHPGWLPGPVAGWLALPPRPPLVSVRDGSRLTVRLLACVPPRLLLELRQASPTSSWQGPRA